jgi:hypothetical protein
MTLRGLLRPKGPLDFGKNVATPQDAQRALMQALKRQNERLAESEAEAVDVQLLAQATPAVEWPKLLAYWERHKPSGVASWPRRLERGAYALNLWPLPAGRVGRAAGLGGDVRKRQPKTMLSAPGLTVFDPERSASDATTALAVVCATWAGRCRYDRFQGAAPGAARVRGMGYRGSARLACGRGLRFGVVAGGCGRGLGTQPRDEGDASAPLICQRTPGPNSRTTPAGLISSQ